MPIDITPVPGARAIRFQDSSALPAPAERRATAAAAQDAGVVVEANPALGDTATPIDAERVAEIRKALEDGSYPVVPSKIADAMIAARLLLSTTR